MLPIVTPPADPAASAIMTPAQYAEAAAFAALPQEERASALFAKHQQLELSAALPATSAPASVQAKDDLLVIIKSPAIHEVAEVNGQLAWVGDIRNGRLAIGLTADGEKKRLEDGTLPLRAMRLTPELSKQFYSAFANRVIRKGDFMAVTVETPNLQRDLDNGIGLKRRPYFDGTKIVVTTKSGADNE